MEPKQQLIGDLMAAGTIRESFARAKAHEAALAAAGIQYRVESLYTKAGEKGGSRVGLRDGDSAEWFADVFYGRNGKKGTAAEHRRALSTLFDKQGRVPEGWHTAGEPR